MRIRTQLAAAFLLLAVVPLTSIVLFSYVTSIRAVERAVEAEASERTAEMDQRMKDIRRQLDRGVAGLSQMSFGPLLGHPGAAAPGPAAPGAAAPGAAAPTGAFMKRLLTEIGDAAPLVNGLVVVPKPSHPEEGTPRPPAPGEAPAPPEPPRPPFADFETLPFRIDIAGLEEALEASGEGNVDTDPGEADAELGRQSAEMAMIGLSKAVEALRQLGDEKAQTEIEKDLARELKIRTEKIAEHVQKATQHAVVAALRAEERRAADERRRLAENLLGRKLGFEVHDRGAVVAEVHAEVNPEEVLHRVLEMKRREPGEIPFALDSEGTLYSLRPDERQVLESLELECDPDTGRARSRRHRDEWMIVSTAAPEPGVIFGVAHPIGASLAEIRKTTARNLAIGLAFVGLALLGVLPLSKHITRGLEAVTEGAKRVAHGDLSTRVPVTSGNEVGLLASAFNRMAEDLKAHQELLLEEEGRRKEQELEFERKSRELEDARQFQLSLLPKSVPRHPSLEVAVDMRTAAEVGGDYYDFHVAGDGTLTLAIGDATGHGARAGTMVTVVKSLFSSAAADQPLSDFLQQAARTIKRMDLGRMAMALTVARCRGDRLTLSAAGMPPALVYRAGSGEVEELALAGMPLGGLASDYEERGTSLAAGDTLLLLSDGLPELPNAAGEPLGYPAVRDAFAAAAAKPPGEVIEALTATAARWAGGGPPSDDMTFVVVRKKS